jgi:hypothetical protein
MHRLLRKILHSLAWWFMPVIPEFGRLRQEDHLNSGVQDHLRTPSQTKATKERS